MPVSSVPFEALQPRDRSLRVGGLVPFTTVDFPGRLSAVVFVQGCPWRCGYCHNRHLQGRADTRFNRDALDDRWRSTLAWLGCRQGLLDGVVFSGGEPTADPALRDAVVDVQHQGYAVGLHTAGTHPRRLVGLLPELEWVGLDIKAPLNQSPLYDRITGRRGSALLAAEALALVQASGCDYEVRTTVHAGWLDPETLQSMAADLAARGVRRWVLQPARSTPECPSSTTTINPDTLDRLRGVMGEVCIRSV